MQVMPFGLGYRMTIGQTGVSGFVNYKNSNF